MRAQKHHHTQTKLRKAARARRHSSHNPRPPRQLAHRQQLWEQPCTSPESSARRRRLSLRPAAAAAASRSRAARCSRRGSSSSSRGGASASPAPSRWARLPPARRSRSRWRRRPSTSRSSARGCCRTGRRTCTTGRRPAGRSSGTSCSTPTSTSTGPTIRFFSTAQGAACAGPASSRWLKARKCYLQKLKWRRSCSKGNPRRGDWRARQRWAMQIQLDR